MTYLQSLEKLRSEIIEEGYFTAIDLLTITKIDFAVASYKVWRRKFPQTELLAAASAALELLHSVPTPEKVFEVYDDLKAAIEEAK